jgi:RND superfamily putative drug exporter
MLDNARYVDQLRERAAAWPGRASTIRSPPCCPRARPRASQARSAVGAAFGVVTAVFQKGFLAGPLGVGTGPIEAFLPVMMLAILFGLSMDYQVFLVSRMHEEWMNTYDNSHSVRIGQAATGRVITAAATIMILVFSSFLLAGQRVIAEFGIGLASAVLLDAFILRTVLVPAVMHVLGERNWWLPRGLDRALPRVAVEGVER